MHSNRLLFSVVFISGMSVLALEISSSRLLAPYFGTSLFVWTNIIGIILIALSVGYYYGGKMADKYPKEKILYTTTFLTGLYIILIPFISQPILRFSVKAFDIQSIDLFYVSLLSTLVILALPIVILGMVSPFAIRIASKNIGSIGNTSGSIYALSTIGSIIGAFLPALVTIPLVGTKITIMLFGFILALISVLALRNKKLLAAPFVFLLFILLLGSVKPSQGLIYEDESIYNYIQVIEEADGTRYLVLNEGHAVHSMYNPNSTSVRRYWGYFNLLPLMNKEAKDVLMIGLAAGTISKQYSYYFPEIEIIDGVEIDPDIVDVGKEYFDMDEPKLNIHIKDGRTFLHQTDKKYDIITVDAYKQPYIPFHLTTEEFFKEVKSHLNEGGVVGINVATVSEDSDILKMIINTVTKVYKNVYIIPVKGAFNFLVVASDYDYNIDEIETNDGNLKAILDEIKARYKKVEYNPNTLVLTDDKAPVEILTDIMIYDYVKNK